MTDKQEVNQDQINTPFQTTITIVSSMIGGTILVLPLLFNQAGLGTSLIIMIISCYACFKTSYLYVLHLENSEKDVQETIMRVLGPFWYRFFNYISSLYLLLSSVLYFYLTNEMLYKIVEIISIETSGFPIASENQFTFSQVSIQWITLATFFPFLALLFIKELNVLVKIASYGFYATLCYICFIFYAFFSNFGNIQTEYKSEKIFSIDIGSLAGTAPVAFQVQSTIGPIIKSNKQQDKNQSVVLNAFLIGLPIYSMIGILGGFGILGRTHIENNTIIDFFVDQPLAPLIVEVMYLGNLISLFPISFAVAKRRVFEIIYPDGNVPAKITYTTNISFMVFTAAIRMTPGLSPSQIINLNGSVCCFFIIYLFPIMIHFACLYPNWGFLNQIRSGNQGNHISKGSERISDNKSSISSENSSFLNQNEKDQETWGSRYTDFSLADEDVLKEATFKSYAILREQYSFNTRLVLYSIFLLFGFTIMIYGITTFVLQVSGKE